MANNTTFTQSGLTTSGNISVTGNTIPTSIWSMANPVNLNNVIYSASTANPTFNIGTTNTGLTVNGTMAADDYMIQGQSIKSTLDKINERLSILVPDPKKLAKYAALKEAYEHYKLLEKLCSEPDK